MLFDIEDPSLVHDSPSIRLNFGGIRKKPRKPKDLHESVIEEDMTGKGGRTGLLEALECAKEKTRWW